MNLCAVFSQQQKIVWEFERSEARNVDQLKTSSFHVTAPLHV